MKKLLSYLVYVVNLPVALVWAYALVWASQNDGSVSFYLWCLLMILVSIQNIVLQKRVNQLERN